jgi:hypothetical protein
MPNSEDYRKYLDTRFDSITTLVNAQFTDVHTRLDGIHEQAVKTNGGLTKAKEDIVALQISDIKHIAVCPAMPKITEIQNDLLEYKWFKQHPKLGLVIVAVCSALILFNVYGIIGKDKVAKELVKYNQEQVIDYKNLIHVMDSIADAKRK